jgi:heme/copper-type cytochrome/quinol oxidase subunit 2
MDARQHSSPIQEPRRNRLWVNDRDIATETWGTFCSMLLIATIYNIVVNIYTIFHIFCLNNAARRTTTWSNGALLLVLLFIWLYNVFALFVLYQLRLTTPIRQNDKSIQRLACSKSEFRQCSSSVQGGWFIHSGEEESECCCVQHLATLTSPNSFVNVSLSF